MRIALIAPTHLPARRANTVQVMKMAQALVSLGQEVRVWVPGRPPTPVDWGELAHHYGLQARFEVRWLPCRERLRRYDYALAALWQARRWGAGLVYTRLPQAAALASQLGLPVVLEVHDLPASRMGAWLFERFAAGPGGRALVIITAALQQALQQALPAAFEALQSRSVPLILAPDGVDLERYADLPQPLQARQELGLSPLPPAGFWAGYSGHLYAGRGAELILALAARRPAVNFLLVGGEPQDVARLQHAAQAAGLTNLTLTGFIPNAELPRWQAACDVLLMPYQEQVAASSGGDIGRFLSPMKLFEYLACGRAILSSDLPVLREVLNEQNAVLLPASDPEAWAAALAALQADPERRARLAAQARQDAGQYTWQARAQKILEAIA